MKANRYATHVPMDWHSPIVYMDLHTSTRCAIIHLWIGTTEMETQDEPRIEFFSYNRWFNLLYMIYCVVPSIHMSEHHWGLSF